MLGEGAEIYTRLFIFTRRAHVREPRSSGDPRRGPGSAGGFTHVSSSTVGASVSSKSVIVPAGSRPHPLCTYPGARITGGSSPLLFKTTLRRVAAPFAAALPAPPTARPRLCQPTDEYSPRPRGERVKERPAILRRDSLLPSAPPWIRAWQPIAAGRNLVTLLSGCAR